jgi:hypothetical protein
MSSLERTRRRVVAAQARRPQVKLQAVRVIFDQDPDPEASYLDQDEFEDRRAEYKRGEFNFVSARAEADVVIEGILQTLQSGGLNGIESDSEQEYLDEIGTEEWKALRGVLKTVGVPTSELPVEVDPGWVEWRI